MCVYVPLGYSSFASKRREKPVHAAPFDASTQVKSMKFHRVFFSQVQNCFFLVNCVITSLLAHLNPLVKIYPMDTFILVYSHTRSHRISHALMALRKGPLEEQIKSDSHSFLSIAHQLTKSQNCARSTSCLPHQTGVLRPQCRR